MHRNIEKQLNMLNDSLERQKIKLNLNIYFNTKVAKTSA